MRQDANAPGRRHDLRSVLLSARDGLARLAPGLFLTALIAMASAFIAGHHGGPVMLYALLFGMAFNFLAGNEKCAAGITFSSRTLLRISVALLGVRITLGDVAVLGPMTVLLIIGGVVFTIGAGWAVGRAFGLRSDHAVLSAGSVAICGASAALAIAAVLPRHENAERNTILTVVGVTTLSTAAMVLYPLITETLGFDDRAAGIFLGATIHDVAQVIGAGYMISDTAGETAAVVKLMRVACLVPAVMAIALVFRRDGRVGTDSDMARPVKTPVLPAFLVGFVILVLANSTGMIPAIIADSMGAGSRWGLLIAVSALGIKTSLKDIFTVGFNPVAVLLIQTVLLAVFASCAISVSAYLAL